MKQFSRSKKSFKLELAAKRALYEDQWGDTFPVACRRPRKEVLEAVISNRRWVDITIDVGEK